MAKPNDLPIWNETEERVTQPDVTRQQTGFIWSGTKFEKPKGEHFNWLFNNIYKWIKYLDEALNINALTEKVTLNANDEFLIEDSEDSNTKKKAKLSSIASLVSFDIASTLEAQEQTNDTKAITPLKLKEALQGANQSLTSNGYQKLPGGLIIQWGRTSSPTADSVVVNLPVAFPNAGLQGFASDVDVLINRNVSITNLTTTQITVYNDGGAEGGETAWFALGY